MTEIIDLIVLEQFLMDLGGQTQRWVRRHPPKSMEEVLQLTKDYVAAEAKGHNPRRERGTETPQALRPEGGQRVRRAEAPWNPTREGRRWDNKEFICYWCVEKCHVARACPQKVLHETSSNYPHEEQVDCSFGRRKGPWRNNKLVVEVKIMGTLIPTMVDTGCSQTMVRPDLILP